MTVQLELAYTLKKVKSKNRFDSELLVRIPLAGEMLLLPPELMESSPASAVMGVWQEGSSSTLTFVRHAQIAGLEFPLPEEIRKLRFRILTSLEVAGQTRDVAITYPITKDCWMETAGDSLPGQNWIALVTCENGEFQLRFRTEGGGPGGGSPCVEMNCAGTAVVSQKLYCLVCGCYAA